jgi:RNA polymerase sigma-70 factor (ECF subfamily)
MLLVYGVCMKYLKNRDDSKDAVMQIFEVLVKDIPKFEIKNFRAWLHGVCRNHCLMKIRKDQSEKNRLDKIQHEYFMESESETHLFDKNDDEQLQLRLKECMEKLKAEQRRCLELFYYEATCYRDIAATLELDENNVKSYIQNGKRNLKICIETQTTVKNVKDQSTI